jgi:hypothetical protein
MPNSIFVQLSNEQIERAAIVGVRRELRAIREGLKDRYDWDRDGWKQHIEGAFGEIAAATALGMEWTGEDINQFKGADVGANIQVRYRPGDFKDLSLRKTDSKKDLFLLVLPGDLKNHIFEVVGWMPGEEAMTERFYHEDKRLWFVPSYHLRDPQTIPGYTPPKVDEELGLWR